MLGGRGDEVLARFRIDTMPRATAGADTRIYLWLALWCSGQVAAENHLSQLGDNSHLNCADGEMTSLIDHDSV